jgi:uncharacterized RDD family membrane protein YckC
MSNQVPPPNSPGQPISTGGAGAGDTAAAPKEILLARWVDRFIAWIIDFVIVNVAVWIVVGLVLASQSFFDMEQMMVFDGDNGNDFFFDRGGPGAGWWWSGGFLSGTLSFLITSLVFFGYWTYFEYTRGQSIGKMVMRIKTTDLYGNKPSLKSVMLESFGKSFLLVIDIILGWIFTDDKRQRIFNRAGNTIVIKIVDEKKLKDKRGPPNITYGKD